MKTSSYLLLAVLSITVACSRTAPEITSGDEQRVEYPVEHEAIVLGKRLDDPYAVRNMRSALNAVYPTKAGRQQIGITDLYVRFLPKDTDEYDRLADMGVIMYDHPLDYEIVKDGDYYHDPELDEDQITWQYAVVKPDFDFPKDIVYEICDSCCIPTIRRTVRSVNDEIDWEAVEREAYRLTGNEDKLLPQTKAGTSGCPSGRITIEDDKYDDGQPIGVAGVMVSVNSFVKFSSAYTDEQGFYQIPREYSSDVRYRLIFSNRKGFDIGLNLILIPASTSALGIGSNSGMDVQVDKYSDRKLFSRCVVNNAAWDYFEMCEDELMPVGRPPSNLRFWLFQNLNASSAVFLHQGVLLNMDYLSNLLGLYKFLIQIFMPDITLGLKNCADYSEIYAAAVHEMAHASHFMKTKEEYWNSLIGYILMSFFTTGNIYGNGGGSGAGYCEVSEMWAYYLENQLFKERYGKKSPNYSTTYWFSPQVLVNLDERGLNRSMIYDALTADVVNADGLKSKLIELYPSEKNMIEQVFNRYSE